MEKLCKRCFGTLCLAVSLLLLPMMPGVSPALASEITAESDARTRMNLAGRQRMLTQRIARNACFVMAGVDQKRFASETEANVEMFNAVVLGLRQGDENLGILAESDPEVLIALKEVETLWATLGPAARQISAGDVHSIPMQQLINLNMETLKRMHATVQTMAGRYQNSNSSADVVTTVAVAGRQRMLTQKVSKELCFRAIGLEKVGADSLVQDTVNQFDVAMRKLLEGSEADGIIAPPTDDIKQQLLLTNALWEDMKSLVSQTRETQEISHETRVELARMSDQVLKEMNRAVQMYVQ